MPALLASPEPALLDRAEGPQTPIRAPFAGLAVRRHVYLTPKSKRQRRPWRPGHALDLSSRAPRSRRLRYRLRAGSAALRLETAGGLEAGVNQAASVVVPEATIEVIASLGEHRVLSTAQVHAIHLPGRGLRRTPQLLADLERAGLICHAEARSAPRRLWFLSERGADLAVEVGGLSERPKLLGPGDAAGPLRAHTLAVNEVGISFLEAAREGGDDFGPLSWRHEVAHPLNRGRGRSRRTLFADAVLTYLLLEERHITVEQRFIELDRATLSVDRLVSELVRYAQLSRGRGRRQAAVALSLSQLPADRLRLGGRLARCAGPPARRRADAARKRSPARPGLRGDDLLLPAR